MTYDPRYQPRQRYPDPRGYQQPYDWLTVPQYQRPPLPPQNAPKRSRAGLLFAGAVVVSVISAAVGGATALTVSSPHSRTSTMTIANNGAPPPARVQPGSVEDVAAKVVPSVVKLETKLGRASGEGSGIILSSDGLILTNNHVVSVPGAGAERPGRRRRPPRRSTAAAPRRSRSSAPIR